MWDVLIKCFLQCSSYDYQLSWTYSKCHFNLTNQKKLTESSSRSYQYQWQYFYQIVKHLDPSYCEQFISSFITVDRNFSFFNWIRPENRLSLHNKKNGFCYDSAQGMFETKIMNIIFVVWYNMFRTFFWKYFSIILLKSQFSMMIT